MLHRLRQLIWLLLTVVGMAMLSMTLADERHSDNDAKVLTLRIDGAIGPASVDFISRGINRATEENAQLVVLVMDTPGGLDTSMRLIIKDILASPVPVATFVSPEGARAASAGTFILYASHIAAMAPATNLGAASPVAIGGGPPRLPTQDDTNGDEADISENGEEARPARPARSGDPGMDKAINDAAAYIRSLAELRERNAEFAERAVREADSMSASEALEAGVIEYLARNLDDLMQQLDGKEVTLDVGHTITLSTADAPIERLEPDWRTEMLSLLSNPQLALVLMMIGIYGLFFEFTSPGFGVPGVAGLISIVLALFAFQLMPINWAGVALITLGAILMLAEAFVPSFGVLGVGGIIAFVVGGMFLFDGEVPGYGLPMSFIITMAVFSAALLFAVGTFAIKARQRRVVSGSEEMIGATGRITACSDGDCYAHIHGESWRVRPPSPMNEGEAVRVTAVKGLILEVEALTDDDENDDHIPLGRNTP